ncbi:MAG TPA: hypothetical protein VHP31_04390 [Caproicibacter sp.]|nr:hypothetical protein [Caproicibacter sp.]
MKQTPEMYMQGYDEEPQVVKNFVKWFKRIVLSAVLLLILLSVAECGIFALHVDNFFTIASIPTGTCQTTDVYQKVFGNDEAYALAKNFRGEPIFRNPAAAFSKMEKETAPLLEEMQKTEKLPAFSATTYRKYLTVFGMPAAYPGHDEVMAQKVFFTCRIYINSTQLTFGPKKEPMG